MAKCFIVIVNFLFSLVTYGQVSDAYSKCRTDLKQFISDIRQSELSTGQIILVNQPISLATETVLFYAARNRDVFTSLDTGFIARQIDAYKNFQWDTTIVDSARIVSQSTVDTIFKNSKEGSGWERFTKLYGREELYHLSLPIFTLDKNYCIVEIHRSCGSLCGTYCVVVFKRHGKQWKRFKELECSVS